MSEPYLSEIKVVSFNFAPKGWAMCNGQFLPINQNQALFALLGTTYGGNGQTTFALPNLRGQVPIHFSGSHQLGEAAGTTSVTINQQTMPTHTHQLMGRGEIVDADFGPQDPTGRLYAGAQVSLQGGNKVAGSIYANPSNLVTLNPGAVSNTGGSQPHNNMMPYLTLNFIIALQGIFPSRN